MAPLQRFAPALVAATQLAATSLSSGCSGPLLGSTDASTAPAGADPRAAADPNSVADLLYGDDPPLVETGRRCENEEAVDDEGDGDGVIDDDLAALGPAAPGGTIRVYVHVLHDGDVGKISAEAIAEQIAVLDAAFDAGGFGFVLEDVDWVDDPDWAAMTRGSAEEGAAKAVLRRGVGLADLDVYTTGAGAGSSIGWATYPWDAARRGVGGVVIASGTVPGGDAAPFDEGDALVHQVGHWMGLLHPSTGGCSGGDRIADTPAEATPARRCSPPGRDTCAAPGLDPTANYMDGAGDACATHFTAGQRARMARMFAAFRAG